MLRVRHPRPCAGGLGFDEQLRAIGDPVDVVTGAESHFETDFRVPGAAFPFSWVRHYDSRRAQIDRGIGAGFRFMFDVELRVDIDGLTTVDGRAREIAFPFLGGDGDRDDTEAQRDAHVLRRLSHHRYQLDAPDGAPSVELELGRDLMVPGRPTALVGPPGCVIRLAHDGKGLARVDLGPLGQLAIERDGARFGAVWLTTSVDGQRRRLARYGYDDAGRLAEVENAYGHVLRYAYDDAGRLARKTDRRGYSFLFTYDGEGRCIHTRGEDGVADFRFDYRPHERLTVVTRGDGAISRYFYDEQGSIIQVIDPVGGLTAFLKDDDGRVVKQIDPAGNESRVLYDALGVAVAKVDPLGHLRALPADPRPHPLDHFQPTNPAAWEQGRRHLPPPGAAPTSEAALVDRLLPEWARGAVGPTPEAPLRPTKIVRDVLGLELREERSDGKTRRWGLDPNGYPRWTTDFDGHTTHFEHRSWNLLARREEPLRRVTEYQHTSSERIKSVVDPGGSRTEFGYDLKDRLIEVRRNGRVRERYAYDAADNLVEKRDGEGALILKLTIGRGNLVKQRELASGDRWDLTHDKHGFLTEGKNRAGSCAFEYGDKLLDPVVTRDARDGFGVEHALVDGRVVATTVFERFTTTYAVAKDGSTEMQDPARQVQRLRQIAPGLVERSCSNGVRELAHYDLRGRCLLKVAEGEPLEADGWARRFTYTAAGDLARRDDSIRGRTSFHHDDARRLAGVDLPDGTEDRYAYDGADNLVQAPGLVAGLAPGNLLVTANGDRFEHNGRDHVARRRSAAGDTRYRYDSRDQLVAIDAPGLTYEAKHDVLGRRTHKTINGQTWRFYWDDDRLAAEVSPEGRLRIYVYPDGVALVPILFVDYDGVDADPASGRRYHLHTDHLGCPELVLDDQGQTVWRARIMPYGHAVIEVGADFHQPLRWPGHYYDAETGLHENRFRSYSPELGRYLQSDPVGLAGGLNLYAYTANPLRAVDLDGLGQSCPDDVEDCPHRKKSGPDQEEPPALPGVTPEERALAASEEDSPAATAARKKVVIAFLAEHGQEWNGSGYSKPTPDQIGEQLNGHDLGKPVIVGPPPVCPPKQQQWQRRNGKQGSYYANPGTEPTNVGISPVASAPDGTLQNKVAKDYEVKPEAPYLQSTAAPCDDKWSVKNQVVPTKGGAPQRVVPDRRMATSSDN